jgi:hypothetical protein
VGDGPLTPLGPPVQIAYAVPDAPAAAGRWARELGAGPFFVASHIELFDVMHRGRPGTFDHTSAYGQWGSLMVELIEDHGAGPSPVRDVYAPGETGLHHLAFFVDPLDEALKWLLARGHDLAMSARTNGGTKFHFVDARATHGHMLELYEPSGRVRAFYARIADAAHGWNGCDPVRDL